MNFLVFKTHQILTIPTGVQKRQVEEQKWISLENALAIPLASGRITLIKEGMHSSILFAAAFGQEQPLVANTNDQARAQNRRVEMTPVPRAATPNQEAAKP